MFQEIVMSTQIPVIPTHNTIRVDFREWLGPTYGSIAMTSVPAVSPIDLGRPLSIAISREPGAPASATADQLGQRLGWKVYDRALLEQIAAEMHLPAHLLDSVDEHPQSWLTEAVGAFLSPAWRTRKEWVSEDAFVHAVVKTIRRISVGGRCVIVGRGAAFVLPQDATLRVRLIAPLADRVANLSQELGIAKDAAKRKLTESDREQRDFVIKHFHHDPADPCHYDLVLNCERFDVDAQVEQIFSALCQLQVRTAAGGNPSGK
jgi:cytidylate kinase